MMAEETPTTKPQKPGTFKKGVSGNPNGRPPKYKADALLNIDATDADIAAMKTLLDAEKAPYKKRSRKPNDNPRTAKRTPEQDAQAKDAIIMPEYLPVIRNENATDQTYEQPGGEGARLSLKQALTSEQLEAVELLSNMVAPMTVEQVAQTLGRDSSTVYRWIQNADFLQAWKDKTKEQFVQLGTIKALRVYMRELDKASPGSRMMEQIAKSLGFFSDGDSVTVNVVTQATAQQAMLDAGRKAPY